MPFFPAFSAEASPSRPVWLFPVLGLALGVRLFLAFTARLPLHPDETMQYLEQGYRLVHGYGLIPWEYVYGVRSWLIPLFIAAILAPVQAAGFDEPGLYAAFVQIVFCLISLSLPVGVYRLAQALAGERVAILAFLLGCFWHHFAFLAHKPMPDVLSTYTLIWVCVLMFRPPTLRTLVLFGALSSLTLVLRYQLVPVVGLLHLVALVMLRRRYLPVLLATLAVIGAAGFLDSVFWGSFLWSFTENFRMNFSHDLASTFGREDIGFFAREFLGQTWGLIVPAIAGAIAILRRSWPLALALAAGVGAFHVPEHKEFRFLFWLLPFVVIALALLPELVRQYASQRLAVGTILVLFLWAGTASLAYYAAYAGMVPYATENRDRFALFGVLAREPHLTGVEVRAPSVPWWTTGGYYMLGKPVPIRFAGWPREDGRPPDVEHVSHLVLEDDAMPAPGEDFVEVDRIGRFSIWRNRRPTLKVELSAEDLLAPLPFEEKPGTGICETAGNCFPELPKARR
jgi:phosphatidylinositol glycan class B